MNRFRPATNAGSDRLLGRGLLLPVALWRHLNAVRGLEQGESLYLCVGLREREDGRVARRYGLDLGEGEFLAADVLSAAQGVLTGDDFSPGHC